MTEDNRIRELPDRIRAKVSTSAAGCWLWTDKPNKDGYGYVHFEGKRERAHRIVYRLVKGVIPDGLQLDHLCRVRICVNPDHLEPVTSRENTLRGESHVAKQAARTHCARAHWLIEPNLVKALVRRGRRSCLACARARGLVRAAQVQRGEDIRGRLRELADQYYAQIIAASPEEWRATVDRARDARADAEWQHTEGMTP